MPAIATEGGGSRFSWLLSHDVIKGPWRLQLALITDDSVYLLINIAYGEAGKGYKILPVWQTWISWLQLDQMCQEESHNLFSLNSNQWRSRLKLEAGRRTYQTQKAAILLEAVNRFSWISVR